MSVTDLLPPPPKEESDCLVSFPLLLTFVAFSWLTLLEAGFPPWMYIVENMEEVRYMELLAKSSEHAESVPGTVLTALQILLYLNFTILWTWCIIIFLHFFF